MDEATDVSKIELFTPPIANPIEDSIASRTKEITKRPKRERSPPVQVPPPPPKIKKAKEVAPKLPDKIKWTLEEQKQFFSALRIYGKNFEALGQFFNTRRRHVNPEAQKRTFGQIRCFYYRSFRTVSKLYAFSEEERASVDSLELRSVLAYLCLKPKVKYFDKKPTITVLHQLIRNGNAFLRVKGQREHVSIIGKALKPPKVASGLSSTKQSDRTLSKHVKILLSPASSNAYMRVALSCRYPHVEVVLSRSTTVFELMEKLTLYWQLPAQAQCWLREDSSAEQVILYPPGSCLTSVDSTLPTNELPELVVGTQARPRSDSEQSTEPMLDSSWNTTRKRSHPFETDGNCESTAANQSSISPTAAVVSTNKATLARAATLLAAKRVVRNPSHDGTGFTLVDGVDDEADSSAGVFKQRFDAIDLTDEFASEDEGEPDTTAPTTLASTTSAATANNPAVTLPDLAQGIARANALYSTLTVGELQKLLQRPKELRLLYDFQNSSRTNTTESPSAYLHYVIQTANQCLTALAERQAQVEVKTAKKVNSKKQQTLRLKCYCSCCAHHQPGSKDQRRSSTKVVTSPNTHIGTLLQMPPSIPTQDCSTEDMLTVQTSFNTNLNLTCDGDGYQKQAPPVKLDEQTDMVAVPSDPSALHAPSNTVTATITTTSMELPPVHTLLHPISNGVETALSQPKPSAIIFSSNNGVIDDPLIQSLAAEQAASAHNYDLLSYRHKRVRRPLRYGDQSTRSSNTQLLLDANINAQQTVAVNHRLTFNSPNVPTHSNNPFRSDCETPNDLLNENSNMSGVSLSTTIVNAALQSNPTRLRLDWPDNMSDLSFGSFPDLLDSNLSAGELTCFEQSTTGEQNKCAPEDPIADALFAINNTTNLLSQN